jgi:hypothetical protein
VTAQLLYEIQSPAYANPDVVAHFDTLQLAQFAPDRVLISGSTGSPPPPDLKVAVNFLGGYRNTMTLVLTGLDIEEKAAWAREQLFGILGGEERFDEVDVRLLRFDQQDAPSNEQATAHLRVTVKDADPSKVGRRFANATMELALAGYPGFHTTTPPTGESAYGVYWPALVPVEVVTHRVVLPTGQGVVVPHGPTQELEPVCQGAPAGRLPSGPTTRAPLGRVCAARSGDKGGKANIGVWTRDAESFGWLDAYLTEGRLRELLPEAESLEIRRWALPNLNALNFVVVGILGAGVASSARPDPQAKGLGEYLRSRFVDIPDHLLHRGKEAQQ